MSSVRDRAKRLNQGVFISGASGTGKSRMTERLAHPWRRVIYVDPMASFATVTARTWQEAAVALAHFWNARTLPRAPLTFGVTFTNDDDYERFFGALAALMQQSQGRNPNFLLVVDEVDMWSGPKYLNPSLSHIFRYGRHYGCSWIANCRADVQTHRDVRMNAQEILLFRQGMLSPEARGMVNDAIEQRGVVFDSVTRLKRHGPDEPKLAQEYVHFVAVPEPFDEWLPSWEALATDA